MGDRRGRATLAQGTWAVRIAPLLVILIAFALRFHDLGTQSLWNDEGNSLRLAQRGVGDLIDAAGRDIHPPGYYLLLKAWIALAGDREFGLRALSAFEGVLAVAVTLALGRRLFGRGAGWIAGLLVACSPLAVYYSQETRMYAQLQLLSVSGMALLVAWLRAIQRRGRGERLQGESRGALMPFNNLVRRFGLTPKSPLQQSWRGDFPGAFISPSPFRMERGSGGEANHQRSPGHQYARLVGAIHELPRPALALALVNAAGLYTQYSYAFTLLAQGIVVLAWLGGHLRQGTPIRDLRRIVIAYALLNLITLVLLLPWLPTAWDQVTGWPRTGVDLALREQLRTVFTWITYGSTAGEVSWLRLIVPGLLILAALRPDRRARGWQAGLPLFWAGIVIGALFGSGAYRPANLKFLLPAQAAAALLIGAGAARLWGLGKEKTIQRRDRRDNIGEKREEHRDQFLGEPLRENASSRILSSLASFMNLRGLCVEMLLRAVAGIGVIVVVLGQGRALDALYRDPAYARPDYRAMAAAIQAAPRPGDAIILDAPNQAEVFSYYYRGDAPVYELPRGLGGDDAQTRADVDAVIREHRRLFVLFWGEQERDPRRVVQATLDVAAYPVASAWYGDVRLAQYAVLAASPFAPDVLSGARFGDHITLTGYALSADRLTAGDVLGVTLFWTTDAPLEVRYKVTVQLLAPDGSLVSQHDAEPGGNLALTTTWTPGQTVIDLHGLVVPPDRAPGQYTVIVGMYDLNAPLDRLPVIFQGTRAGDHLQLASLEIIG